MWARMWSNRNSHHRWWERKMVQPLCKTVWWFLTKLNKLLPYDSAIALRHIYPRSCKLMSNKKLHMDASGQNVETTKMWINVLESFIFKEISLGSPGIIWPPLSFLCFLPTACLLTLTAHKHICKRGQGTKRKWSSVNFAAFGTPVKELGTEKESSDWNWIWGLSVAASQPATCYILHSTWSAV